MAVSLREVVSFGRYEPLFRIASGGMAEVYAARIRGEAGFQKLVAVKRMHPHMASDPSFVDMFLNEARLAANVASPFVVQTLDLGRGSDGSLYIVMELVVGLSIAVLEEMRGAAFPAALAAEIVAQAAQGLDDAHEATTPAGDPLGLIHRDISPHNILLGLDGRARVTDFGIARAVHRPRAETNVKELKGKFAYMSPEQTRLQTVDRQSDVFSLGIVLWELLVGRRLFADRDPTVSIRNVRARVIRPPHELAPDVPPALSQVALRALERDKALRYPSAAAFAEDLRRVGRDSFSKLPSRKEVAAFVLETGGEELARLQRLIRLGTEGAEPDAIEAIRPGATRVLPGDASGISAVVDSGARRMTARLEEEPPRVPTVALPPDDERDDETTEHLLDDGEVRTSILLAPAVEGAHDDTDVGPVPSEVRAHHASPPGRGGSEITASPPRGPPSGLAPAPPRLVVARPSTSKSPSVALRWVVVALGVAGAILTGAALALLWPEGARRVPLPVEPVRLSPQALTTPATPAPMRGEVQPAPTPVVPTISPTTTTARSRPARAAQPEAEPLEAPSVEGPQAVQEPAVQEPAVEEPAVEEIEEAATTAGRAPRRRRPRRRPSGATPSGSDAPAGSPVLLDVSDFDRHAH